MACHLDAHVPISTMAVEPIHFDLNESQSLHNKELLIRNVPAATLPSHLYSFLRQTGSLAYLKQASDANNGHDFIVKYTDARAAQSCFRHLHKTVFNGQALEIASVAAVSKTTPAKHSGSNDTLPPPDDSDADFRRRRDSDDDGEQDEDGHGQPDASAEPNAKRSKQ
eukprot:TRINITY_DN10550_c0_g1_i2.p2 TRINITY_DN10550_c0_g1~~TRINITY_DN10550_c0_g1_i2.p2  ORF type:complete len:167 (+),score=22.30 TRINITY_DN10550_c0_g1_i2:1749-2249(+)